MVEGVNAVAGSTVQAPDYSIPPEEPPTGELGKDAFLKLLVAQLKYQDPLEPSTSEEFIATTAQFTVVEKLDELTKQGANTALVNSLTTASALVGRQVTATRSGVPVTAVVQQSRIVSGEVVLDTEHGSIGMAEIVSVGPAPETPVAQNQAGHQPDQTNQAESETAAAEVPGEIPVQVAADGVAEIDSTEAEPSVESVTVAPAVEAERTPVPESASTGPSPQPAAAATPVGVPVSSATPASVEDADHTGDAELVDPFDAG